MTPEEKDNCKKAIEKTGFVLERKVSGILEKNRWNVINNRYYVDDVTGTQREIDVLAYKWCLIDNITVFTTLLISCKKSEESAWIFLTRPVDVQDPNFDFFRVANTTNSKILSHYHYDKRLKDAIVKGIDATPAIRSIFHTQRNVFAFQEVDVQRGTPQNDKRIYESIIGIAKALSYEQEAIRQRKKGPVLYNFNLITVLDGRMIEMQWDDTVSPVVAEVDEIKYFNRFIINKKDDYYRVHFVRYDAFERLLSHFTSLVEWQEAFYRSILATYDREFLKEYSVRNLFKEEIRSDLLNYLDFQIRWSYEYDIPKLEQLFLLLGLDESSLAISVGIDDQEIVNRLNTDDSVLSHTKRILEKWARYRGKFMFTVSSDEDDIPF